jgi:hypothetical protein
MYKIILPMCLIFGAYLFSDELTITTPETIKKGSFYAKATSGNNTNSQDIFPGYGLGYRRSNGKHGLDISFNYARFNRDYNDCSYEKFVIWTAPSISYIHYFSPLSANSIYGGVGLGWGESYLIRNTNTSYTEVYDFEGLIPNLMVGYEFLRRESFISFLEFNISQPAVASSLSGSEKPKPYAQLSLGAGF